MNSKRLQKILDHVRRKRYSRLVRSRDPLRIDKIKKTGREVYFNLSPHDVFFRRMVSLVVTGERLKKRYHLGVTFLYSVSSRAYYEGVMKRLTGGNTPISGQYANGSVRDNVLRCEIGSNDDRAALAVFLKFYREVRGRL